MRILIVTQHWFPDALGGAYRVARDQAVGLVAVGHEVTVCALGVAHEPLGKAKINGVTVYRDGHTTARIFGMTAATLWRLPTRIRALSRTRRFDRVIAHDPYSAAAVRAAGVVAPMLYIFHAAVAKEAAVEGLSRWQHGWKKRLAPYLLKRFIKKTEYLEKAALTKAAAVAVFSQYAEEILVQTHPEVAVPGYIVPIGIDTATFAPARDRVVVRHEHGMFDDRFYFVTARRLTPRMGVKELIAAMKIVHRTMSEARLIVAGDGPLRKSLEHEAMRIELDGVVQFVGTLTGHELVSFYQAADCFVLPSQAFETFGLSTAEALATGLPAVGTPVGATPELLQPVDPTLVATGTTPAAIAEVMLRVASMPAEKRSAIAHAGRKFIVDCFDTREATKALGKILAQL